MSLFFNDKSSRKGSYKTIGRYATDECDPNCGEEEGSRIFPEDRFFLLYFWCQTQ